MSSLAAQYEDVQSPVAAQAIDLHAVIFMTTMADATIPSSKTKPACLLPMGWSSMAERVLDACAQAGLKKIDLVVSDKAELIRAQLGDGAQWGLRLNWHLLKDGHTPYGILRDLAKVRQGRVLVGHAHRWLCADSLVALCKKDQVAIVMEPAMRWSGWASMPWLYVNAISPHADAVSLEEIMLQLQAYGAHMVPVNGSAILDNARSLLQLQCSQLDPSFLSNAPASWIRRPWGLQSPNAHVHLNAEITGPVIIGPNCVIEQRSKIGPHVVLTSNIMVTAGAEIKNSLILDDTYVSGALSIEDAVVSESRVQHVLWDVQHVIPQQDALLLPIQKQTNSRNPSSLVGPVLAALLSILLLPVLVICMLGAICTRQAWCWHLESYVQASRTDGNFLKSLELRVLKNANPNWCSRFIRTYAAWLDVVQRRRAWFGVRPRSTGQWYGLRKDWQDLFSQTPIGVWHSPAWIEAGHGNHDEAEAVADAYFSVANTTRLRAKIFIRDILKIPQRT
jgi:hypothetical protein